MAKDWGGKSYDSDFFEIDAMGNRVGQSKDMAASDGWTNANEPWRNTPGWHGQPLTAQQESGLAPQALADRNAWRSQSGIQTTMPSAPTSPNPSSTVPSAFGSATEQQIQKQMQAPVTVDQSDPAYQQQVQAFRLGADRNASRQRASAAQRMAAQGTASSGGLDTAVQRILSDQGAQEQSFEGGLLQAFRDQNVNRQQRALELATGLLGQDKQGALTREGYSLQRELGMGDLNFRRDALAQQLGLSEAQLNQQAMLSLLGL